MSEEQKEHSLRVRAALYPVLDAYNWADVLYALSEIAQDQISGYDQFQASYMECCSQISNGLYNLAQEWGEFLEA